MRLTTTRQLRKLAVWAVPTLSPLCFFSVARAASTTKDDAPAVPRHIALRLPRETSVTSPQIDLRDRDRRLYPTATVRPIF